MADNFTANAGAGGDTFAADDIAGVKYPRSKLGFGVDGAYADVSESAPLPVLISDGTDVAAVVPLGTAVTNSDKGIVTNTVIHGLNSTGGGAFVDVKVSPSGAVQVGGTLDGVTALPLPSGAATESTLSSINSKFQTGVPLDTDSYLPILPVPSFSFRCGFDAAVTNNVDTDYLTLLKTGSGQTVNQTSGSLVITSGTTANAETIIRSNSPFSGNLILRYSTLLSQRIAQNNFKIELVDVIGDGLSYTINSATSVSVTKTSHGFTSKNVGQSMELGAITGAAGIPGRYAIASIPDANTINFTVASWPASGSGTLSLFGWNYHQCHYQSTTATSMDFDCQRNGYRSGATTASINTTASTHVVTLSVSDGEVALADQTGASATGIEISRRASRVRNVPLNETELYLQIRCTNGTTNPASTTTWTVGFVDVGNSFTLPVTIQNVATMSANAGLPCSLESSITQSVNVQNGQTAHSSASTGSPVRIGGRVKTAVDTTLVAGDASDFSATTDGSQVTKPFSVPELDWQYAAAASGIVNTTTAVTVKAAAGAGVRNYITGVQLMAEALGTATEFAIRDGAAGTVIWRTKIGTGGLTTGQSYTFPTPLKGTANTLLEIVTLTASTTGAVYCNLQGYTAP